MTHLAAARLARLAVTSLPFALLVACSSAADSSGTGSTPLTSSLAIDECEAAPGVDMGGSNSSLISLQVTGSCDVRGLVANSDGECCNVPTGSVDGGSEGQCSVSALGSNRSCADSGTWRDDASKTCEEQGGTLADFRVADACGKGLYRHAKFTCCSGGTVVIDPPGPPMVCSSMAVENADGVCTPLGQAADEAEAACEAQGLLLSTSTPFQGSCPAGEIQGGSFECCSSAIAPPRDGGPTRGDAGRVDGGPASDGGPGLDCDGGGAADGGGYACQEFAIALVNGECNDEASSRSDAEAQCAASGLSLESWSTTTGSCGRGTFMQASYACCGQGVPVVVVGPQR